MAQEITDKDFKQEVEESKGTVLVDFWAPWCGPCQMSAPIIETISEEFKNKAKVLKLNIDENQEFASKYGVMSIPTFIFFKDGKEVERKIGMQTEDGLRAALKNFLE